MGIQKNCHNGAVLLDTRNICLKLWVKKYLRFYAEMLLSKPMSNKCVNQVPPLSRRMIDPSYKHQQSSGKTLVSRSGQTKLQSEYLYYTMSERYNVTKKTAQFDLNYV